MSLQSNDSKMFIAPDQPLCVVINDEDEKLLAIPTWAPSAIPAPSLPIMALLELVLPPISSDSDSDSNFIVFSNLPPSSVLPDDFASWTVPSQHLVTQRLSQFSQAQRDGHVSIVHMVAPEKPLPFWALSYWKGLLQVLEACRSWSGAHAWVLGRLNAKSTSTSEIAAANRILDIFKRLPWNVNLTRGGSGVGLRTSELPPILGDAMISGNVLDALFAAVKHQMGGDDSNYAVETLVLANVLLLDDNCWLKYRSDKAFTRLRHLGDLLKNGAVRCILFPVNVRSVHWAVFCINAFTWTISYGDSLGWPIPTCYIDVV